MISRSSINGKYPVRRLGEVVEFLDSRRKPVTESDRNAGAYPYFGANGQQGTIDDFLFDEPLVLLAEDGGHFETPERGIAYRIRGKTWVNNHAHVLRPKQEICLDYLCRVLENYDVSPFVTGTTRGKLTKGGAEQIPIPLPPLPEQRRIAAILDKADDLRAKRRTALAHLNGLTQAVFVEMFGDPVANPKGFPLVTIGDLCRTKPNNGIFRKNEEYGEGVPVVWVEELFRGSSIDTGRSRRLAPTADERQKYALSFGDILFCRSSLKLGGIGFNNVYLGRDGEALFECHLIRVSPDLTRVEPRFLNVLLRMPSQRLKLFQQAKTVTMTTIDQNGLQRIDLPLPPIAMQSEFSRFFEKVERNRQLQNPTVERLDALFNALQHRAFAGEL